MQMEMFHCVELFSGKSEITEYTRWGANNRCHKLNKWNPSERWIVASLGLQYIPNYDEQRRHKC